MKAPIAATALSSSLSLVTVSALVFGGASLARAAAVSALLAFAAGAAGVAFAISSARAARAELEAARADAESARAGAPSVKGLIESLADRVKAAGEGTAASQGVTDGTARGGACGTTSRALESRLREASTAEDLALAVVALDGECRRAERLLESVSDHVITDASVFLPFADAIIRAVPAKTEEAAMTVMDKFLVVKESSMNAAASGRALRETLDSADGKSIARASEASRDAVRKEREAIRELSSATKENRGRLGEMSAEIASGLELLKNINEITEQSKLIAFNMSVEAARLGEKGNGFRVIIAELHKLNGRTADFSKKVADLLRRFKDRTVELVDGMELKSMDVVKEAERGMDAAEAAVESLIDASTKTETYTREIAGMSDSICEDLDRVLESLQFQDITRQMMEGALAIIRDMEKSLETCLRECGMRVDESERKSRFDAAKRRLIAGAKTVGEKEALMEVEL